MFHPSDTAGFSNHVRDSRSGPVTCATCGCRLEATGRADVWRHFSPLAGRDARGCRVDCVDLEHDASGRVLVAA